MQSVTVRPVAPGDGAGIVKLLRETLDWPGFEHQGDELDFWRWRYLQNVNGLTIGTIVLDGTDVISHAACLPTEVKLGDQPILAAQWSDLFTNPNHRGRGLVEKAIAEMIQLEEAKGIAMDFAFPSPAGYEVLMKIGFQDMPVKIAQYELIVDPKRFFRKVRFGSAKLVAYETMHLLKGRGGNPDPSVTMEEVKRFPEDIKELVEQFEREFTFILHRTVDYLNWRFTDPDSGIFRVLIARREGKPTGYIVVKPYSTDGHGFLDIVDIMTLSRDTGTLSALIERAVAIGKEGGMNTIQIWLPTDHPFLPELGRSGFYMHQPVPGERRLSLICRSVGNDGLIDQLLQTDLKYHIVLGDSDWV